MTLRTFRIGDSKDKSASLRIATTRYLPRGVRKAAYARQTIKLLAAMTKRMPVSIGCYCEDERRSHRSALARLIRRADRL